MPLHFSFDIEIVIEIVFGYDFRLCYPYSCGTGGDADDRKMFREGAAWAAPFLYSPS